VVSGAIQNVTFPEESGDYEERLRFLRKLIDLSLPNLYDSGGKNISEVFGSKYLGEMVWVAYRK